MTQASAKASWMTDPAESARLMGIYGDLRLRLLDLSRRNQLLNYGLSARSKRLLRIVDCSLEDAHRQLVGQESTLQIEPLPEPDTIPSEERTEEFRLALDRARATDIDYLATLDALEATSRDDDVAFERLERQLRDRVRNELGFPPRPSRSEINRNEHAREINIDPSFDLDPSCSNGRGCLQTLVFPDELEAVMEKIVAGARLAEQELGLSTLFLAFGFLEWYDNDASDKKAYAPLLLLPVQIEKLRRRGKPVYSVTAREEAAEANLSLQKLLEQKFSRALPDFDSDEEADTRSIETYLAKVKAAVEGLKRWQVRRWIVLGHFSFGRFAMYSDLEPQKWGEPTGHPLVAPFLRGAEYKDEETWIAGDYEIDDPKIDSVAPFLIQDADASQHSAIVDVMKGANLVIQGPPGTGKSQTITNILANALVAGKRVLFLAEKQAALEVVKRRLDRAGLGDFCLELHSDKVAPKTVVASLASRYELGVGRSASAVHSIDPTWRKSREEIVSYVQALHQRASDGATPFSLIWQTLRGNSQNPDLASVLKQVNLPAELLQDSDGFSDVKDEVQIFADIAQTFADYFGHPALSPWSRIEFGEFPSYDAARFLQTLSSLGCHTQSIQKVISRYSALGIVSTDDLHILTDLDRKLGDAPEFEVLACISGLDLDDLERALATQSEFLRTERDLTAMSDLRYEDPQRLAIATGLMRSTAGAEYSESAPVSAYRSAAHEVNVLRQLINAIESMLPALDLLSLGQNIPASRLQSIATITSVVGMASLNARRWISEFPQASKVSVEKAADRWRSLAAADCIMGQQARGLPF